MSSGFNKFLQTGSGDIEGLQNGTQHVYSSTLSAANLLASLPCKTDVSRIIQSTKLDIADTLLLQATLDAKLANPMTGNLDAGQFNIFDLSNIQIDTAGSGTDIATLEYNGTGNVTIDLNSLASHVDSSSIPSTDNRIAVYDGAGGETIRQSTTILENAGALSGVASITLTVDSLNNTKYGFQCLNSITSGLRNIAIGDTAGSNLTTADDNICMGYQAMLGCVSCVENAVLGCQAFQNHSASSDRNVAIGYRSMQNGDATQTDLNTCVGSFSGQNLKNGDLNVFIGNSSGNSCNTGQTNTCVGASSGGSLTSGGDNIFIGVAAGNSLTTTSDNIMIGNTGIIGSTGQILIGSSGTHTSAAIAGIYNATPGGGSDEMMIMSSTGFMGTLAIPLVSADTVEASIAFVNNNRIVRTDGTSTRNVQQTGILVDNSDNLTTTGVITTSHNISIDTTDANKASKYGFNAGSGAFSQANAQHCCFGEQTLTAANTTFDNSAFGFMALNVSNGLNNCGFGSFSLENITSGTHCCGFGVDSLKNSTVAVNCSAFGDHSQLENIGGLRNSSLGYGSLSDNTSGDDEVAFGYNALVLNDNATGQNTCIGASSYSALTNGTHNIGLGYNSGGNYVSLESDNIMIGHPGLVTENNAIRIGETGNQNFCVIPKELRIETTIGVNTVGFSAPALAGSFTWVLPDGNPTEAGLSLTSDLTGVCSWSRGILPPGYMSGFQQVNTSATVMTFGTISEQSSCRSSDNLFDLEWSGTMTITTSVTGVGGISDTYDPVLSDTAYEVYVVGDTGGTATNILAVESGTAITSAIEISGGTYDKTKRIGWFITENSATDIIVHTCGGRGLARSFHYIGDRAEQTILFAGSATAFTDMSSGGRNSAFFTAPSSHVMTCRVAFGDSSASNEELGFRENGSTLALTQCPYTFSPGSPLAAGELMDFQANVHLPADRIIEYAVTDAANEAYAYVIAFIFGL